jgi:hypothetical protein
MATLATNEGWRSELDAHARLSCTLHNCGRSFRASASSRAGPSSTPIPSEQPVSSSTT